MNPTGKVLGITRRQFVTSSALAVACAGLAPTIAGTEALAHGALRAADGVRTHHASF